MRYLTHILWLPDIWSSWCFCSVHVSERAPKLGIFPRFRFWSAIVHYEMSILLSFSMHLSFSRQIRSKSCLHPMILPGIWCTTMLRLTGPLVYQGKKTKQNLWSFLLWEGYRTPTHDMLNFNECLWLCLYIFADLLCWQFCLVHANVFSFKNAYIQSLGLPSTLIDLAYSQTQLRVGANKNAWA